MEYVGEDFGVMKFDVMVTAESMLCHCQLVGLTKLDVLVLFFQPGLNSLTTCGPDHMHVGCCTHTECLWFQLVLYRTKEAATGFEHTCQTLRKKLDKSSVIAHVRPLRDNAPTQDPH